VGAAVATSLKDLAASFKATLDAYSGKAFYTKCTRASASVTGGRHVFTTGGGKCRCNSYKCGCGYCSSCNEFM
jgi:hypothetical protein